MENNVAYYCLWPKVGPKKLPQFVLPRIKHSDFKRLHTIKYYRRTFEPRSRVSETYRACGHCPVRIPALLPLIFSRVASFSLTPTRVSFPVALDDAIQTRDTAILLNRHRSQQQQQAMPSAAWACRPVLLDAIETAAPCSVRPSGRRRSQT